MKMIVKRFQVIFSFYLILWLMVSPMMVGAELPARIEKKSINSKSPVDKFTDRASNPPVRRVMIGKKLADARILAKLPGQSVTLLPTGDWLLIGGQDGDLPSGAVYLQNSLTKEIRAVSGNLSNPRAWHSATLLPSGEVLIFGGVDERGEPVTSAEMFNPADGRFRLVDLKNLTPRAYHTATLLTDGKVLFAGGRSSDDAAALSAEILNPRTEIGSPLGAALTRFREKHNAVLQPDGTVLLFNGFGEGGVKLDDGELYDPKSRRLTPSGSFFDYDDQTAPQVRESIPENGAVGMPVDTIFGARFSKPVEVSSVKDASFTMKGSEGEIAAKVTVAEGGMLVFFSPLTPLQEGTTYTVSMTGAADVEGRALPYTIISFTTARRVEQQIEDDPDWTPDASNLRGDWRSHRPRSLWEDIPALEAPAGVTAVSGRVLLLSGNPLPGVTVQIGESSTVTDSAGRFLLVKVAGGHRVMRLDGRTANTEKKTYGFFKIGVDVQPGRTNVLPYTSWMPKIDTKNAVVFDSPTDREVAVTTPHIPNLEVRVPAKAVVRDEDGKVIDRLSITPIPVDRTPFPLPPNINVPVFFTVQPGASRVIPPRARAIYPNYNHESPGARISFWSYDPEVKGWYVYGQGTVTPDGRQIVPDLGVVIYEFTGFMVGGPGMAPGEGPSPSDGANDGDPVDLSTGLFVYSQTDLVLPDTIPITLTRTYRPRDFVSRPFGIGATHPYEIFLVGDTGPYTYMELVLPNGGRLRFERISAGGGYMDAVYEHTSSRTGFYKARITWLNQAGGGWILKLRDGTQFQFPESDGANFPRQAAVTKVTDRYGSFLECRRDAGKNLTKLVGTGGRFIDFTYDTANRITEAKDNTGRTVGYTYDAEGRLWKVTDTKGGVTEYNYDSSQRMLTVKDPRGIVYLTNEYDTNGRVIKQTQADSSIFLFSYTTNATTGRVTQTDVTDERGNIRRVTFNDVGLMVTDTAALGKPEEQTMTFERQPLTNQLLSLTDPLNRRMEYTYDASGNVTATTLLAGTSEAVTTAFTYDPIINGIASITDPLNHTTSFTYDEAGNLTTTTDALNHQNTFTYDAAGRMLTTTDPLNHTIRLGYDGADLTTMTDPLGRVVNRTVDAAGRPQQTAGPLGNASILEFDAANRPTKLTDQLGSSTTASYDPNGNQLGLADPRSGNTTYTYDNMDRPKTRTDALQGATSTSTVDYDPAGNPIKVTDRRGKVATYKYDALNRCTFAGFGTTGTEISPIYESTISYTYDKGNRLREIVDSIAGTSTFEYDNLDRLISQTMPQGGITYTYDAAGRLMTMTVAEQPVVNYTYDAADRLIAITKGTETVGFDYDNANRQISLTLPNGVSTFYEYDAAGQLTGILYKKGAATLGNLTYMYDLGGRRTKTGGSLARTELPAILSGATTYDAANRLKQRGATTLTYDANGNLTSDGTTTYTWNARNELVSLARSGLTASFQHDPFGRRVSKTVNGVTTAYLYDGANAVQEKNGAGTVTANMLTGGTDEVFSRSETGATRTLLHDGMGSTLSLLDNSGTTLTSYSYDPFGTTTATGAASSNSTKFTGREDDGTGLYYYRARYYSPALQRFISEDPIGHSGGVNLYAYVGNSPTNFRDPSGKIPIDTVVDVAFIGYDVYALATGGRKDFWGNLGALGADVGGLFIPYATGLGLAYRARKLAKRADKLMDATDLARHTNCFVSGTLIHTEKGLKPIEQVKAGDKVLSYNENAGQIEYQEIVQLFRNTADEFLKIKIEGESEALTVTPGHPFYAHRTRSDLSSSSQEDGDWMLSKSLKIGDLLRDKTGAWKPILSIEKIRENANTYNFEVSGNHNYFVGGQGWLVHNQSLTGRARFEVGPNGAAIPTSKTELEQSFKNAGLNSYPNTRGGETGTNYIDPANGNIYRVMDGSSYNQPRLMTHAPAGNPLTPYGTSIPPGVTGKSAVRDITHFPLEP